MGSLTAPNNRDNNSAASTWRERRRARKLRKAELRLADAEHNLRKWGFGNTPSQDAAERARIERLRRKVEDLGG